MFKRILTLAAVCILVAGTFLAVNTESSQAGNGNGNGNGKGNFNAPNNGKVKKCHRPDWRRHGSIVHDSIPIHE